MKQNWLVDGWQSVHPDRRVGLRAANDDLLRRVHLQQQPATSTPVKHDDVIKKYKLSDHIKLLLHNYNLGHLLGDYHEQGLLLLWFWGQTSRHLSKNHPSNLPQTRPECIRGRHTRNNSFSPLGKVAGRAIYFTDVFSIFFNCRLSSHRSSDTNGAIFTKISRLVDRCKGLLTSLSFFDFSRDVAMATSQSRKIGVFTGPIYFVTMPFGNWMG